MFYKRKNFWGSYTNRIINLINAINKFDLNRNANSFTSYALWTIKNGFRYLCRSEIRYNDELSLNKTNDEGFELGETIVDSKTNVESVIQDIIYENLYLALEN